MPSEARIFLESLFGGKPEELYLQFGLTLEQEPLWFSATEEAILFVEDLGEHDLFVGMGLTEKDDGPTVRRQPEEVVAIVGFSANIDLCSDVLTKPTLPRSIEHALSILPKDLPPSFVVFSGNGVHAVWVLQEPYLLENDEDRETVATLVSRLHTLVRDNARLRGGWTIGKPGDMVPLMRVPGTTNWEDPANPKPVTIHSRSDRRYSPAELMERLDDMEVPYQNVSSEATRERGHRLNDKALIINLASNIPEGLLNEWLETDDIFKKTWFRQRSDLRDQSQSGYDLALARFGLSVGLAEQQIVDLIIQHRVIHQQKARTRLDYFYRILSKAADDGYAGRVRSAADSQSTGDAAGSGAHHPCGASSKTDSRPAANPERNKIELLDEISEALGVRVLRIVKLSGNEPVYRMELSDGKIHFENIRKLISQSAVQGAIAACAGKLIPDFKPGTWLRLVQSMLDACVVEEGGEELECEGAIRMHLARYLSEATFIRAIEGQSSQDLRKPMVREGRIAVCASDLQLFINKTTMENLPVRALAAMLSSIGAKTIRVRGRKIREQSRWELPVDDFDPSDYSQP